MEAKRQPPATVLIIAGHDPSGAAGIQADIESVNACGARCATLITALTTQNTARFDGLMAQAPDEFLKQARMLCADMRFDACKVGMLGSCELADAIHDVISGLDDVPVVLDPVLATGTGIHIADDSMIDAMCRRLLPLTTVITPNLPEALRLTGAKTPDAAATALLGIGCHNVLITGGDEPSRQVINRFYAGDRTPREFRWERIDGTFHGTGCTLSAALAAHLAQGQDLLDAVEQAQAFTWRSVRDAVKLGQGQKHPTRTGM